MNWRTFRDEAPELATVADEWIVQQHVLLLGTLRADGWPRISAVECDLVGDDLCIGMIWRSVKALDLERDPRLTVHSLPPGRENTAGDLKLSAFADPRNPQTAGSRLGARYAVMPPAPLAALSVGSSSVQRHC